MYAAFRLPTIRSIVFPQMTQEVAQFFAQFHDFDFNPQSGISKEFRRLAKQRKWGDKRRRQERSKFQDAIAEEFNGVYGTDVDDLPSWHRLCREIRLTPLPQSITDCRKVRNSLQTRSATVNTVYLNTGCQRRPCQYCWLTRLKEQWQTCTGFQELRTT
jgi:hypothetical protein